MLLKKFDLNIFLFLILCFALLIFSINIPLIGPLRILDITFLFLICLVTLSKPEIDKKYLKIIFFIFCVFLISSLIGILKSGFLIQQNLIFFYKYFFIITVPWLVISIVKKFNQLKIINYILLYTFIMMIIWIYVYVYLASEGKIHGNIRPSYPFGNYRFSDAHLLSSYIGFFTVAYLVYIKDFFKHNFFLSFFITTNAFLSLVLTGSRTGIFLILIYFFLYFIPKFLMTISIRILNLKKISGNILNNIIYFLISIFILILIYNLFKSLFIELFNKYSWLINRSIKSDIFFDQSFLTRISKQSLGLNEAKYSFWLLGVGVNSQSWYDGILGLIFAHGGLLLFLSILIFYSNIFYTAYSKSIDKEKLIKLYVLSIIYLLSNLITEHIFISRNSFPILVIISIVYIDATNKKFIIK